MSKFQQLKETRQKCSSVFFWLVVFEGEVGVGVERKEAPKGQQINSEHLVHETAV